MSTSPRIRPLEFQDATAEQRALYERLREDLGIEPNNFFKTIGHHPGLLGPMIAMSQAMLEDGVLERRLKEWVILQVARQHQCGYVYEAHKMALSRALTTDVVDGGSLEQSTQTPAERLAIRYAGQITLNAVEDETFTELREHFTEPQIVELTVLASYYNAVCRIVSALGVQMDDLKFLAPTVVPGNA